jgi:hypothetical protein
MLTYADVCCILQVDIEVVDLIVYELLPLSCSVSEGLQAAMIKVVAAVAAYCCSILLQHTVAAYCCSILLQHTVAAYCCSKVVATVAAYYYTGCKRHSGSCTCMRTHI